MRSVRTRNVIARVHRLLCVRLNCNACRIAGPIAVCCMTPNKTPRCNDHGTMSTAERKPATMDPLFSCHVHPCGPRHNASLLAAYLDRCCCKVKRSHLLSYKAIAVDKKKSCWLHMCMQSINFEASMPEPRAAR
jgi:hypothetical protein